MYIFATVSIRKNDFRWSLPFGLLRTKYKILKASEWFILKLDYYGILIFGYQTSHLYNPIAKYEIGSLGISTTERLNPARLNIFHLGTSIFL